MVVSYYYGGGYLVLCTTRLKDHSRTLLERDPLHISPTAADCHMICLSYGVLCLTRMNMELPFLILDLGACAYVGQLYVSPKEITFLPGCLDPGISEHQTRCLDPTQ